MTRLREYYAGKTILLTGGTGLVGKVLIEAILRQFPDINKLYALVRSKSRPNGTVESAAERLWQDVQKAALFDFLRSLYGDAFPAFFREKVEAVDGDLSQEGLGLEKETYVRLQRQVDVIINCAALVTFNAPIDNSLNLNTFGPRRILDFARGCHHPVVAQVSTCYVNATRSGPIHEDPPNPLTTVGHLKGQPQKPYDVEQEANSIIRKAAQIRSRVTDREKAERKLAEMGMNWAHARGWHDVYTFTKAMGEQLFVRYKGDINGTIVRPAIIESAYRSPQPGWLNGFRMLDPLIVAYGKGKMLDFPGNAQGILDIIPVDFVANAILAVIPQSYSGQANLVYQVASGMENPLTLQGFADLVDGHFQKRPLNGDDQVVPLKKPTFPTTKRFLRRMRYRYFLPLRIMQLGLAPLAFISGIRRKRASYRVKASALERLKQYGRLYGPYAETQSKFMTENTRHLWSSLHPQDQQAFDFDISQVDWKEYIQDVHIPGVKRYLLGMPDRDSRPKPSPPVTARQFSPTPQQSPRQEALDRQTAPDSTAGASEGQSVVIDHRIKSQDLLKPLISNPPQPEELEHWVHSGPMSKAIYKVSWAYMNLGFKYWLGFHSEGIQNIPAEGPFIIASNHCSHLDTPAIFLALGEKGKKVYAAAATDYFFENRKFVGWFVHSVCKAVPFDRYGPLTEGLGLPIGILRSGGSIIFYPEGGRTKTGEMQPFKAGIGMLALASGVPVVPTRIDGTYNSMPKGHSLPKRHLITVRFGEPIQVYPYRKMAKEASVSDACRTLTRNLQKAVESLDVSKQPTVHL